MSGMNRSRVMLEPKRGSLTLMYKKSTSASVDKEARVPDSMTPSNVSRASFLKSKSTPINPSRSQVRYRVFPTKRETVSIFCSLRQRSWMASGKRLAGNVAGPQALSAGSVRRSGRRIRQNRFNGDLVTGLTVFGKNGVNVIELQLISFEKFLSKTVHHGPFRP